MTLVMLLKKIDMLHISSFLYSHISLLLNTLGLNLSQTLYKILVCPMIQILILISSLSLVIILYIILHSLLQHPMSIVYILVLILSLSLPCIMIYCLDPVSPDNNSHFPLLAQNNYYCYCAPLTSSHILLTLLLSLLSLVPLTPSRSPPTSPLSIPLSMV